MRQRSGGCLSGRYNLNETMSRAIGRELSVWRRRRSWHSCLKERTSEMCSATILYRIVKTTGRKVEMKAIGTPRHSTIAARSSGRWVMRDSSKTWLEAQKAKVMLFSLLLFSVMKVNGSSSSLNTSRNASLTRIPSTPYSWSELEW